MILSTLSFDIVQWMYGDIFMEGASVGKINVKLTLKGLSYIEEAQPGIMFVIFTEYLELMFIGDVLSNNILL